MNKYKKRDGLSVAYLKGNGKWKWHVQCNYADSAESMSKIIGIPAEEYIKVMRDRYGATIKKGEIFTSVCFDTREEAVNAYIWVDSLMVAAKLRRSNMCHDKR